MLRRRIELEDEHVIVGRTCKRRCLDRDLAGAASIGENLVNPTLIEAV